MIIHMKLKIINARKLFSTHFTTVMTMDTFNMLTQRTCTSIDFVTSFTIVSNFLMNAFDMMVHMLLERKSFVTLITTVSIVLMNAFHMPVQTLL